MYLYAPYKWSVFHTERTSFHPYKKHLRALILPISHLSLDCQIVFFVFGHSDRCGYSIICPVSSLSVVSSILRACLLHKHLVHWWDSLSSSCFQNKYEPQLWLSGTALYQYTWSPGWRPEHHKKIKLKRQGRETLSFTESQQLHSNMEKSAAKCCLLGMA